MCEVCVCVVCVCDSTVRHTAIGQLFPPLPRSNRLFRSRGNRLNHSSNISCGEFFEMLDDLIINNLHNAFNEIRKILNLAKKKVLKEIAFQIMEKENFTFHENRFQIYEYVLDIIDSKFYRSTSQKT